MRSCNLSKSSVVSSTLTFPYGGDNKDCPHSHIQISSWNVLAGISTTQGSHSSSCWETLEMCSHSLTLNPPDSTICSQLPKSNGSHVSTTTGICCCANRLNFGRRDGGGWGRSESESSERERSSPPGPVRDRLELLLLVVRDDSERRREPLRSKSSSERLGESMAGRQ